MDLSLKQTPECMTVVTVQYRVTTRDAIWVALVMHRCVGSEVRMRRLFSRKPIAVLEGRSPMCPAISRTQIPDAKRNEESGQGIQRNANIFF